jgi:lysophospholipase L1-like esterase
MDRKRILVFGDSNSWGFVPNPTGDPTTRYDASTRWPRVMINRLGAGFELIEEGLSARTTNLDDPQFDIPSVHLKGATLNGAMILPAILASHLPLDLVVIMLGTNDLKARFNRSASETAQAVVSLAGLIADCKGGVATVYGSPQVLLVAPPALGGGFRDPADWTGGVEKSLELGPALRAAAAAADLPFFNAGEVITTDGGDGIHFSAGSQRKLGEAVAEKALLILGNS